MRSIGISLNLAIRLFLRWVSILLLSSHSFGAAYTELGMGASQIRNGSRLFGGGPGSTRYGFGSNYSFANAFGTADSLMQLHLGLQARLTTGNEKGMEYDMISLYPLVRFEFPRYYVGFGAAPLVWHHKGANDSAGYVRSSALGAFGETGLIWRIVPFYYMSLAASAETTAAGGGLSPRFAYQFTFQMRFFFDGKGLGGGRRKYDGWRYPFGVNLF